MNNITKTIVCGLSALALYACSSDNASAPEQTVSQAPGNNVEQRHVRIDPPDEKAFSSPELAHLYSLLREAAARGAPASLAAMSEQLSPEEMNLLTGIIQQSDDSTQRSRALADYIQTIRDEALRRDSTDLREAARRMKERKAYGDKV